MPSFKYQEARQAGWEDSEIAEFLQQQKASGVDMWIDKEEYKTKQPDGFLKSTAKAIAKPFAEAGTSAYNLISSVNAMKNNAPDKAAQEISASRDIPFLGETKPAFDGTESTGEAAKKIGGYGTEIGSWFVGGGGAKAIAGQTLKGQILKGLATGAKVGSVSGALAGGGRAAQDDGSAGDIAIGTAVGGLGGALLGSAIGAAAPAVGKGVKKVLEPIETKVSNVLREAIDKGLKPTLKQSAQKADEFYTKAVDAFKIIKKYSPEITNEEGELIAKNPETRKEMLEALSKSKSKIYDEYHSAAVQAGGDGVQYNPKIATTKLNEVMSSKKYNPEIRKYASELFYQLDELNGQPPDVIEARIQDLNSSLTGFYEGRVSKAKAQIDASVASLMRKDLDELIEKSTGVEYQALKNEYGSLKAIEKDLTRQVLLEARKNPAGLIDMTDIFTGADLLIGAVSSNPVMFAKGLTGQSIKWYMKWLNNPNRYIKNAFDILEKEAKINPPIPKTFKMPKPSSQLRLPAGNPTTPTAPIEMGASVPKSGVLPQPNIPYAKQVPRPGQLVLPERASQKPIITQPPTTYEAPAKVNGRTLKQKQTIVGKERTLEPKKNFERTLDQKIETPKTVRVWKKSRFSEGGGYDDVPVLRKEENITLYQGGKTGDKRQFWTPNKKYAEQFGEVKEKTGTFYKVDNGNRVTDVYVEAPVEKQSNYKTENTYGSIKGSEAKLDSIEIKPSQQKKGIGTKEVKDFEKWALENGAKTVKIDAYKKSTGFWEKMGYTLEKDFPIIGGKKQDYKDGIKILNNERTLGLEDPLVKTNINATQSKPDTFISSISQVPDKHKPFLSNYTKEEYGQMKVFLDKSGKAGYAIKPDGDLVSVFNYGERGQGKKVIKEAIKNGATKLDAFDIFLPEYYKQFGFKEVKRIPWDDNYAPVGWDYEKSGRPDIVYMELK